MKKRNLHLVVRWKIASRRRVKFHATARTPFHVLVASASTTAASRHCTYRIDHERSACTLKRCCIANCSEAIDHRQDHFVAPSEDPLSDGLRPNFHISRNARKLFLCFRPSKAKVSHSAFLLASRKCSIFSVDESNMCEGLFFSPFFCRTARPDSASRNFVD